MQHAASRGYVALTEMAAPQWGPAEDLLELLALSDAEPGPRILPYSGRADDLRRTGHRDH